MNSVYPTLLEKDGTLYLEDERMILTSSTVFGTLRRDLIENIGADRMKGFLIRYGWNLGVNDAKRVLTKDYHSLKDILKQGPVLHMMKGYTSVQTSFLDLEYDSNDHVKSVHVEGAWKSSYEAEEHLRQFGFTTECVCHTLVGYASGYYSQVCGHRVLFKEIRCKALGDQDCTYVGKSMPLWSGEVDKEAVYYENATIVHELKTTYQQLLQEKNNLSKTFTIDKKLTEALVSGNELQEMTAIVYQENETAIVVENLHGHVLASSGVSEEQLEKRKAEVRKHGSQQAFFKNKQVYNQDQSVMNVLTTPFFLEKKRIGYCSMLYNHKTESQEKDQMVLERLATVCALYLMNEKNAFEASERMKGHFLEQMVSGDLSSKEEIIKRGQFIGMDLEKPYYIAVMTYREKHSTQQSELYVHDQVMKSITDYFKKQANALIGQRNQSITLLIQTDNNLPTIQKQCSLLIDYVKKRFNKHIFKLGISTKSESIIGSPTYLKEASTALALTTKANTLTLFEELSMSGMLIHSTNKNEIKQKAKHLLGPLFEQRDQYSDFIKTLYFFLLHGGNLEQTKDALSLSKSGLRYRISRIEQLIGKSVRDPASSYQVLLTLQVLIAEGEIQID